MPMRTPSPKNARTWKRLELMLTALMATALSGRRPTIMVSTMAMDIQPSSDRTKGKARWRVGRSWPRKWKLALEANSAGGDAVDGVRTDMIRGRSQEEYK